MRGIGACAPLLRGLGRIATLPVLLACGAPLVAASSAAEVPAVRPEASGAVAPAALRPTDAPTADTREAAGNASYREVLTREALRRGLPPAVADAVAYVESGYDPGARGAVGELGLMQVRPSTAAMLGHVGPATDLLDPETNIRFGVAYLARAWKLAGGDLCRALMKYRAGHGEERMTPRSAGYCERARQRLASTGAPLLSPAPPAVTRADVPSPLPAAGRARQAALSALNRRIWAEHVARIRAIEARTERIMRGG
ncbi:transglycosylase SLT domain-containing protein [Methylobacterium sp. JK268]